MSKTATKTAKPQAHVELWEPDPSWTKPRREAFVAYRDMPDRTLSGLSKQLHKSIALLGVWSRENEWQKRTAAWDVECDRRRREEFHLHGADVAREQAEDAAKLRGALLAPARAVIERIERLREKGIDPFGDLTPAELVRLSATAGRAFAQVATVERLAHGLSTENIGGSDGGPLFADVERKSMEELQAYLAGRDDERKAREETMIQEKAKT
jgi:hypothetical protein